MAGLLKQMKAFKRALTRGPDLTVAAEAFFDLTDNPAFSDHGVRVTDTPFASYLEAATRVLFGEIVPATPLVILHDGRFDLYHGVCEVGGHSGTFVFFLEEKLGLLILREGSSDRTRLVRMRADPEDDTAVPAEAAEG